MLYEQNIYRSKEFIIGSFLILLGMTGAFAFVTYNRSYSELGNLGIDVGSLFTGESGVRYRNGGSAIWQDVPSKNKKNLAVGDSIFTSGGGTATVGLKEGTELTIQPNSLVIFTAKREAHKGKSELKNVLQIKKGGIQVRVTENKHEELFVEVKGKTFALVTEPQKPSETPTPNAAPPTAPLNAILAGGESPSPTPIALNSDRSPSPEATEAMPSNPAKISEAKKEPALPKDEVKIYSISVDEASDKPIVTVRTEVPKTKPMETSGNHELAATVNTTPAESTTLATAQPPTGPDAASPAMPAPIAAEPVPQEIVLQESVLQEQPIEEPATPAVVVVAAEVKNIELKHEAEFHVAAPKPTPVPVLEEKLAKVEPLEAPVVAVTLAPPTPAPLPTPELVAVEPVCKIPDRKPAEEENASVMRPSRIHFELGMGYSTISGTDPTSGAVANFSSGLNLDLKASWIQSWTDQFKTQIFGKVLRESYLQPLAPNTLTNANLTLARFGIGFTDSLLNWIDLNGALSIGQEVWPRSTSDTDVTLDTVLVPDSTFGFVIHVIQVSRYSLNFSGSGRYLIGIKNNSYVLSSGTGYSLGLDLSQLRLSNSVLKCGISYASFSQNSNIVLLNRNDINLKCGFEFEW